MTNADLDEPIYSYDVRGLKCPLPVLKTQRKMKEMAGGSVLWVITSDPMAVIDIPHFCQEAGHDLLRSEVIENGHRFLIKKVEL